MENWTNIHKDFEYEWCQNLWKEHGFGYQITKQWKEVLGENFTTNDFAFCTWLQNEKHLTPQEVRKQNNAKSLKQEYKKLWTDIHEDFGKSWPNYQQSWEQQNCTYQEAQEWIKSGFTSDDYWKVKSWKDQGFSPQQTKPWIQVGLKLNEYKFASYLKQSNYWPNSLNETQLTELKNHYYQAQNWLNFHYPNKQTTTEIINSEQLHGSLIITDYPQLATIHISGQNNLTNLQINNCPQLVRLVHDDLWNNKTNLTNLTLTNCPQLKELTACNGKLTNLDLTNFLQLEKFDLRNNSLTSLNLLNNQKLKELNVSHNQLTNLEINHLKDLEELNVYNNKLTNLNLNNCVNLKGLHCSDNKLTNLDLRNNLLLETLYIGNNNFPKQDLFFLSHLVNLKKLGLGSNQFTGSLEFLKRMSKLELLYIDDTDIDSGLEYLPDSLKSFSCSAYREDAKVKIIDQELKKHESLFKMGVVLSSTLLKMVAKKIAIATENYFTTDWKETVKLKEKEAKVWKEIGDEIKAVDDNTTLHQRWKKANLSKLNYQKLEEQLKTLEEEKAKLTQRITDLEILKAENERLIQAQKSKIGESVNNYLPLLEEEDKQTIQKLIQAHQDYIKAKKSRENSSKLFKQFLNIRQKLEVKLGEELMEILEIVLTNFEELYQREWNLQQQNEQLETNKILVKEHTKLIEELTWDKQKLKEITASYLEEKQEQLNKLLACNENNLILIEQAQEEVKIIQEELTKIEEAEQTFRILQPIPGPSKP